MGLSFKISAIGGASLLIIALSPLFCTAQQIVSESITVINTAAQLESYGSPKRVKVVNSLNQFEKQSTFWEAGSYSKANPKLKGKLYDGGRASQGKPERAYSKGANKPANTTVSQIPSSISADFSNNKGRGSNKFKSSNFATIKNKGKSSETLGGSDHATIKNNKSTSAAKTSRSRSR